MVCSLNLWRFFDSAKLKKRISKLKKQYVFELVSINILLFFDSATIGLSIFALFLIVLLTSSDSASN